MCPVCNNVIKAKRGSKNRYCTSAFIRFPALCSGTPGGHRLCDKICLGKMLSRFISNDGHFDLKSLVFLVFSLYRFHLLLQCLKLLSPGPSIAHTLRNSFAG